MGTIRTKWHLTMGNFAHIRRTQLHLANVGKQWHLAIDNMAQDGTFRRATWHAMACNGQLGAQWHLGKDNLAHNGTLTRATLAHDGTSTRASLAHVGTFTWATWHTMAPLDGQLCTRGYRGITSLGTPGAPHVGYTDIGNLVYKGTLTWATFAHGGHLG